MIAHENSTGTLSTTEQKHLFCYLLARAFSQASNQAGRLLTIAFDTVYAAAQKSDLNKDDWALVSEAVTPPRWWLAWDRCGTLRFAVAVLCREGIVTAEEFLGCTDSDERFTALVEELSEHWWGRRFLRNVARQGARSSRRRAAMIEHL